MKKYTIILLAVALTAVFAVTAMANEWNLYGSARVATFYVNDKLDDRQNFDDADRSSIKNTTWNLQGNSRIGANVKGDVIDAQFEFGVTSDGGGGNVSSRRLYGVWKFADGWGLKVGKDYTPMTFFLSGQAFDNDAGLLNVGNAYGARRGQLELRGKAGPGMLKVALIDNPAGTLSIVDPDGVGVGTDYIGAGNESYFPKLEASYQMMFGDLGSAHAFAGWANQKFYYNETTAGVTTNQSETTTSWMVGLGGEFNFGPMFVKPQASYYVNGNAAGWTNAIENSDDVATGAESSTGPLLVAGKLIDANTVMAMLALGFSPTEQLTLELGGGWVYNREKDDTNLKDHTYYELYLQAVYAMAPGVFLVPEIGYRDYGSLDFDTAVNVPELGGLVTSADLGNLWYVGAKWQINF